MKTIVLVLWVNQNYLRYRMHLDLKWQFSEHIRDYFVSQTEAGGGGSNRSRFKIIENCRRSL